MTKGFLAETTFFSALTGQHHNETAFSENSVTAVSRLHGLYGNYVFLFAATQDETGTITYNPDEPVMCLDGSKEIYAYVDNGEPL